MKSDADSSKGAQAADEPSQTDPEKRPPPRSKMHRLLILLRSAVICYLVYAAMLFSIQRWLLFPRHIRQASPDAGRGIRDLERFWIDTPQGRVEGWFIRGHGASAETPGPAVIFAHGNAELIEDWPFEMSLYQAHGFGILLPEFRGYGRSAGSPSEAAITEDFVKFYDWLAARPDVDRARIVFHGRSIGGGAVCALSRHRRPAAIVLQSTFVSVSEMSRRYYVPSFLVRDPFDNESALRALKCPVLIVHGKRDSLIPFEHAQRLHAAAAGSKLIAYDCDHNDCPPDWNAFMHDVIVFLRGAGIAR